MHMTTQTPQKSLGGGKAPGLGLTQHPQPYHIRHRINGIGIAGYPKQGMQVAQPPLAILDIGLQHIAVGVAFQVAGVPFFDFGINKTEPRVRHDLAGKTGFEAGGKLAIPQQVSHIQQAGTDSNIALGRDYGLADAATCMPHLQAQIPQHIKDVFNHLIACLAGGCPILSQKQQINIRVGAELASPIATGGNDRQLGGGGVTYFAINKSNDSVNQHGMPAQVGRPVIAGAKLFCQHVPPLG